MLVHPDPRPACPSLGSTPSPFSTRSGVAGNSWMSPPRRLSASATAQVTAPSAPMIEPFAAALEAAERRRRRVGMMQLDPRNFQGGRDQIIGQRHGARLAGLVVHEFLQQRLADALGDAADDLPLDHRGIDDGADVFRGDVADDLHLAGLRIDVHHDDVSACGEAAEFGVVEGRDLETLIELLAEYPWRRNSSFPPCRGARCSWTDRPSEPRC